MRIPVSGVLICCLFAMGCKKVEDLQPQSDFEKSTAELPTFNIFLDSTGSQVIQFDSIAQGGNFSVSLSGFKHCKLKIQNQGKTLLLEAQGKNWKGDTSRYIICKNNTCRDGSIFLTNKQYIVDTGGNGPVDKCVSLIFKSRNYDEINGGEIFVDSLFPAGFIGSIRNISSINYVASKFSDVLLLYKVYPDLINSKKWGWDTIRYDLTALDGKCYKVKIPYTIGDVCEASAKDDNLLVTNGFKLILEDELTLNDKNCAGLAVPSTTRSGLDFGTKYVQLTQFGRLEDTLIVAGNKRGYRYYKTNPSAIKDKFPYYFRDLITNRVTKAWVYLLLN